jgi:hypothetical protein
MSNIHRRPSKNASYQVSIHLANSFREEDFLEINQKKIFFSATAFPNELKFGRKHPWKVLYQDCSFRDSLKTWPSQAILVSDWSISKNLLL